MSKVVVYTQAYNAEKTLRRSLDSVLGQTVRDLTYYVADDCSKDGTRSIIQEYAAKDRRVRPIYYDTDDKTGSAALRVFRGIGHIREAAEFEWLCVLDADDVYKPEFLQEMLEFSSRLNLDMAVCSTRFIQADTGEQICIRGIPQEILIKGQGFGELFPIYHQFMRTWWAKLISRSVVERADLKSLERNPSMGGDTMLAFEFLRHCRRVGISPRLLHDYAVSPDSVSYRMDPNRIGADAIQHYDTVDFLKGKVGRVSLENARFLYVIYYHAVVDTLNVLLNASNIAVEEKISGLHRLLSIDVTLEMLKSNAVEMEKRRDLIEALLKFIADLDQTVVFCEEGISLGLTLSALADDRQEYVYFSKLQIQYLIQNQRWNEARAQLSEWESILPEDPDWAQLMNGLDAGGN